LGYVSKNGCEWDLNPFLHQPEDVGIEVTTTMNAGNKRAACLTASIRNLNAALCIDACLSDEWALIAFQGILETAFKRYES